MYHTIRGGWQLLRAGDPAGDVRKGVGCRRSGAAPTLPFGSGVDYRLTAYV